MVFANELQPLIRENFFREICHHASIRENIFREIRHFGDAESRKFLPRKFLLAKISSNKVPTKCVYTEVSKFRKQTRNK